MCVTTSFLFISLVLGAESANAQLADRFKSMDANGDGKISRAEFVGGDGLFSAIDKNKDGFIDVAEAKAFEEARRARKAKADGDTVAKGGTARPSTPVPDDIEVRGDIVYKTVAGQAIALDLYQVKGKTYEKAPLAIFIHGGGYVGGDKQGAVKRHPDIFVPLLCDHGYLVASLNYRLCTPQGAKLIDCSTDCKDAVRFLVKNSATYGIDPHRIASMGTSAGGSLSLLLPLTKDDDLPGDPELVKYPSRTRCAISWFGCTDFAQRDMMKEFNTQRIEQRTPILFHATPDESLREHELVSPVWYMKRNAVKPPMLLVHGDSDKTVPVRQSVWMHGESQKFGVPVTFVQVKNAGHGFQEASGPISPTREEINKLTLNFILEHNQ